MNRTVPFIPGSVRNRGEIPLSDEARQAIIDQRRAMKDVRRFARVNRERIDAEWDALPDAKPMTIAGHIAAARKRMGEARWNELQAEFAK